MSSVLRPVRKRKKGHTLGPVNIIQREDYTDLELDTKVELIRSLIPLGLMHVQEVLDQEVTALAGERYAWKDASVGGRRHGTNPGTVGLAGQRVPIRVPRMRSVAGSEIPLRSYEAWRGDGEVNDLLLTRVLYGISCRNYEAAAETIPGAIGLSGSTVSRGFIQASTAKLREFQERDLSSEDVVAVVLDGKTFTDAVMVIAVGITISGEKRFLGFVETDTENVRVLTPFLRSLVERGLDLAQGVLKRIPLVRSTQSWYSCGAGGGRGRVLDRSTTPCAARCGRGVAVGRARREVLRQSRVGRSAEAASARNRRGGASQANPLAHADPPSPARGAGGPDPRAAGSHAGRITGGPAHAGESPHAVPHDQTARLPVKKKRYTRRNTIALTSASPARPGAPRRRRSIPRAACFSMRVVCGPI